jgi:hypothetical protein
MRTSNWIRTGALATAAFGLLASANASAQKTNWAYCGDYARNACTHDEYGQPIQLTIECYQAEFQACLASFAALEVKTPGTYDKRQSLAAAARPARRG